MRVTNGLFSSAQRSTNMFESSGNVGLALAQRRHQDADHLEAMVEVLAELTGLARLLERLVGGGHDPRVDADRRVAADAREHPVLEHVQQLGLERRAHLADLVEQDGAALRQLELALLALMGAGERATLVAEQLGLQQIVRDGGAVDLDERLLAPIRLVVDVAGDHFLADAGLAHDQDGHVGAGRRGRTAP